MIENDNINLPTSGTRKINTSMNLANLYDITDEMTEDIRLINKQITILIKNSEDNINAMSYLLSQVKNLRERITEIEK